MSAFISKTLIGMLTADVFEKVAKQVIVAVLKELSKRTDNTLDDTAVAALEDALL